MEIRCDEECPYRSFVLPPPALVRSPLTPHNRSRRQSAAVCKSPVHLTIACSWGRDARMNPEPSLELLELALVLPMLVRLLG